MEKYCALTRATIDKQNDSRAHIIPSALGGQLKPTGILTQEANTKLNDLFDTPLVQALSPLMAIIGGNRDRGENQPVTMKDESGVEYRYRNGQPTERTRPEITRVETDKGTEYTFKARTKKELRTLLGMVKKEKPDFDIDKALDAATVTEEWPEGPLHAQLEMGPRRIFPGLFVAACLFASHSGADINDILKDYVDGFNQDEPAMPSNVFYFYHAKKLFEPNYNIGHSIVLFADPEKRSMIVIFDLFSVYRVAVVLPFQGTASLTNSYSIDIESGEEKPLKVHYYRFKKMEWKATHGLGEDAFYDIVTSRLEKLLDAAAKREWDAKITELQRQLDALLQTPVSTAGEAVDRYVALADTLADFTNKELSSPYLSVEKKERFIKKYEMMMDNLAQKVPSTVSPLFPAIKRATLPKMQELVRKDEN